MSILIEWASLVLLVGGVGWLMYWAGVERGRNEDALVEEEA